MLIVEGPDGAGKTTLIERLKADLGLEVAPRVVSKEAKALVNLVEWVDDNLNRGFQHLIFDRHRLISQPIYGPAMKRTSQGFDGIHQISYWMRRFYEIDPIIIYCLPRKSTVLKNVLGDKSNAVVWNIIGPIYDAYVTRAAIDLSRTPAGEPTRVFIYDYEIYDTYYPAMLAAIRNRLEHS
jgi:GTPase SAR1 family protein